MIRVKQRALLIGVNQYQDPRVRPLAFSVRDARAMAELLSELGYEVTLLCDDAAAPTRAAIEDALGRLCAEADRATRLLLYFAGHGTLEAGQQLLLPADALRADLPGTALRLDRAEALLRESRASQKVLLLDACHSGVDIGRGLEEVTDQDFLQQLHGRALGFGVLAASSARQKAQEIDEDVDHGLFTYFLLAGLRGQADRRALGFVTLGDLKDYVCANVARWSARHRVLVQEPTFRIEGLGDMPLTERYAAPRWSVRRRAPAFAPPEPGRFRHGRHALLCRAASPAHGAADALVTPGAALTTQAKFAYGAVSKDLEDEPVRLFLEQDGAFVAAGSATTDADGRAAVRLTAPAEPGAYALRWVVEGDASVAGAALYVARAGTALVLFDLDGTLTKTGQEVVTEVFTELFQPLLRGSFVPLPRPGAAVLSQAHAERGHLPVYLSERPDWLTRLTRDWLAGQGFVPGPLLLYPGHGPAGVAPKRALVAGLQQAGFAVTAAYGDTPEDAESYLGAGLPAERVWIVGPHGGVRGCGAPGESLEERARQVRGER